MKNTVIVLGTKKELTDKQAYFLEDELSRLFIPLARKLKLGSVLTLEVKHFYKSCPACKYRRE